MTIGHLTRSLDIE